MKQSVSKYPQMIDLINVCNNKSYVLSDAQIPIWDTREKGEGKKKSRQELD